jgi:hypothetical protein
MPGWVLSIITYLVTHPEVIEKVASAVKAHEEAKK